MDALAHFRLVDEQRYLIVGADVHEGIDRGARIAGGRSARTWQMKAEQQSARERSRRLEEVPSIQCFDVHRRDTPRRRVPE